MGEPVVQSNHEEHVLNRTRQHVQQAMSGEGTGHDWWHVHRVVQNALALAREEQADAYVVELAALLHDLGDHKFYDGDLTVGPRMAAEWLTKLGAASATVEQVAQIIREVSFKGAEVATPVSTLEAAVVQDADRLDALGAIGIARTFAYGGHRGQPLYDPDHPPTPHDSFDAYHKDQGSTINHFYEKLLLLKDRMNTTTGKRMAVQRHQTMESFLEAFYAEWAGDR